MFIEDELIQFLEEVLKRGKVDRNAELILYHFGFFNAIWPTQDETGALYVIGSDGRKAERVSQIIEQDFAAKVTPDSLQSLRACAKLLSFYDFIGVKDFSKLLQEQGLLRDQNKANIIGFLNLMHQLNLCEEYQLYRPDLKIVSRESIFKFPLNFIIQKSILQDLTTGFSIAEKLPSDTGIASFSTLKEKLGANYLYADHIHALLQADPKNTCFTDENGEFYYHTSKGKNIINFLKTVFTVKHKVEINELAIAINNAFGVQGQYYPSEPVVKKFLENYAEIKVAQGFVTYQCEPEKLRSIEIDAIDFFKDKSSVSFSEIHDYLTKVKKHGDSTATKFIDNSPLIYIDKREGRLRHKYSLIGSMTDTKLDQILNLSTILEYISLGALESANSEVETKRKISNEDIKNAVQRAQIIGEIGEDFIDSYLSQKQESNLIDGYLWESRDRATAPYDFKVNELDKSTTYIDVKSTQSGFESPIHISFNELVTMQKTNKYYIYRVYGIEDGESLDAKLKISKNLTGFAKDILSVFKILPEYVKPDSISLPPQKLSFGEEQRICRKPNRR